MLLNESSSDSLNFQTRRSRRGQEKTQLENFKDSSGIVANDLDLSKDDYPFQAPARINLGDKLYGQDKAAEQEEGNFSPRGMTQAHFFKPNRRAVRAINEEQRYMQDNFVEADADMSKLEEEVPGYSPHQSPFQNIGHKQKSTLKKSDSQAMEF